MATFGNSGTSTNFNGNWPDTKGLGRFTLTEAGTVSKLTIRLSNTRDPGHAYCWVMGVIYSDNPAGTPDALKGTTNAVDFANDQAVSWVDFTFAVPVFLTAGDYWLGILGDAAAAGIYFHATDNTTGDDCWNYDTYSDGAADPCGSVSNGTWNYCIYATYTPTSTGFGHTSLIQFGRC